jgi:hypothetical protein
MALRGKKNPLLQTFPLLTVFNHRVTSPAAKTYNCIAWAAGASDRWWWPDGVNYWPPGVPLKTTLAAFKQAYETLGYQECADSQFERGFEKIAIYWLNGSVKHAARQLSNGRWTSKLGSEVDIEHNEPGSIERSSYGFVAAYMKRKI